MLQRIANSRPPDELVQPGNAPGNSWVFREYS